MLTHLLTGVLRGLQWRDDRQVSAAVEAEVGTEQAGTAVAGATCCLSVVLKRQPREAESSGSSRCPSSPQRRRNRSLKQIERGGRDARSNTEEQPSQDTPPFLSLLLHTPPLPFRFFTPTISVCLSLNQTLHAPCPVSMLSSQAASSLSTKHTAKQVHT